jgi:hypothetical protein
MKIFFIPCISAILPKGTAKTAAANRYAVGIQLNKIASAPNSKPIEGRAILIADAIKGVKNEANVATSKAGNRLLILFVCLQDFSVFMIYPRSKISN